MRVLVYTTFLDRSEAAVYRGLRRQGVELELLCDPGAPWQDLAAAGIPVAQAVTRHRLDIAAIRRLRRRLRETPFDVVYAPRNSTLAVALLAARGLPVRIAGYRGTMGHLGRWDPASRLTYLNPRVDRIVCVSEAVRRYLLQFDLPPERVVTIHKGHDPAWYAGLAAPPRAELGIPDAAFVVGFTGNMRPVKGTDVLLRAARLLRGRPDIHYLLVGQIRDRRVRRLAAAPELAPVLHLPGFRRDAAALAQRCDVAVMPSVEREGLPRAVIEAMAQGVPAVVSNVGGMPELVEHGVSGLVVPPREPEALAEAIARLADDPELRARLGRAARARVETAFHIEGTIRKMRELLESLQSSTPRK